MSVIWKYSMFIFLKLPMQQDAWYCFVIVVRNKTVKLYIGSKLLKVKDSFLI